MSFYAYNAVRACSKARGSALAVLHEIADRINDDDNYSHVSVERLAQDCHMSESQAHRSIAKLIMLGDLVVVTRIGRSNLYYIPLYAKEPGYERERCNDPAHRCTNIHAPLALNRRDLMRGLLTGEKPHRSPPSTDGGGVISATPHASETISTTDGGVSSATPGGVIRDTRGVSSATPGGVIRDTQTLSEPPGEPPLNVDTPLPLFVKRAGGEPERPLRWGEDGMPELSPRLRAFGVRRLRTAPWSMTRGDIAHDRPVSFEQWERMHYWGGALSSQAERECEYKRFETAIIARRAQREIIAQHTQELAAEV